MLKLSETTNPKNGKWITVYPNKQNCEDQEQILELLKDETLLFIRNLFKLCGCSFEENKDIFDFIFEARNKYDLYTTKAVDVLTEQQLQNLVKYINYYPKNS